MTPIIFDELFIRTKTEEKAKADIWFLNGLGETGLCWKEGFEFYKDQPFNLYAPDFPGFGSSPARADAKTLKQLTNILHNAISVLSKGQPIVLVAHSLSGPIATWISQAHDCVKYFVNIEGNLSVGDTRFSKKAAECSPKTALSTIKEKIYCACENSPALQRYYASLHFADPLAFHHLAEDLYKHSQGTTPAEEYLALDTKTLYIYGTNSISDESLKFIKDHGLNTCALKAGHWPMIDQPKKCYKAILNFINGHEE